MTANIETMAYTGETPWHGLGTPLPTVATAQEAIIAGGLDWEVTLRPIYLSDNTRIEDKQALVRKTDEKVLQIFGDKYVPLQNREAFGFFDQIVGEGKAIYHTVGSLNGGRQIWILAKLPGAIVVKADDITEKYLLLVNSHDGSSRIKTAFTPIRVVCQNTLNVGLSQASQLQHIRHVGNYMSKFQSAVVLMGIVTEYYERLQQFAQLMARSRITAQQLQDYAVALFPSRMPISEGPLSEEALSELTATVQKKRDKVLELAETGAGASLTAGTVWGAFNAAAEYLDHHSHSYRDPNNRLRDIWFGHTLNQKQLAWDLAAAMVGAERPAAVSVN